jgi:hypothetical protein
MRFERVDSSIDVRQRCLADVRSVIEGVVVNKKGRESQCTGWETTDLINKAKTGQQAWKAGATTYYVGS